jgi:hypothetical protein
MVITLGPELETAIHLHAAKRGESPEVIAGDVLREHFLPSKPTMIPMDDWERRLLAIATPCGVSLPDEALSSEGLY